MASVAPSHPQNTVARKKRWASPVSGTSTPNLRRESKQPDTAPQDTSENQPTAIVYSEPSRKTSNDSKSCNLLTLPSELLYSIASELNGSKAILNFALVNKHINAITQQALIKKLVVPGNRVKQCLELLIRNPDLIEKVNSVDLGDFDCDHRNQCRCLESLNFDSDTLEFLGKTIEANTGGAVNWRDIRGAKRAPNPFASRIRAYFLDVLLLLCPNLKSITLELPEASPFDVNRPHVQSNFALSTLPTPNDRMLPVSPIQGPALRVLQEKLEALTIKEDSRWKGPMKLEILSVHQDLTWKSMGKSAITLGGFTRLKRFDAPMEVLGEPKGVVFLDPTLPAIGIDTRTATEESIKDNNKPTNKQPTMLNKVIPLTLKYIYLRSCNQHTFALLQRLNNVSIEHLQVQEINIFFSTCPRVSVTRCYSADEGKLQYSRILSELAQKNVKIRFYTGKYDTPFDMEKEIAAMYLLSPFEAWSFALLGKQFAELNSRASAKRLLSTNAHRLFLKHCQHYFPLLNRPSFNGNAWTDVGFFHGIQNTKWDHGILPPKLKVSAFDPKLWPTRISGKREAKRRLPFLPGKIFSFF